MTTLKTTPCRACSVPLVFVKTPEGKTIPLDARGHVYHVHKDLTDQPVATRAEPVFFVSHWLTCTDPNRFSASKKGPA